MALFKKEKPSEELTPKNIGKKMQALEAQLQHVTERVSKLQVQAKQTMSKVGVVRFNAFKEVGGNQSFSVALLSEQHNGVVITSYYGRDLNRVYAKEITGGVCEYDLSEEETQAIAQAAGLENPKHEARNPKRV